MDRTIQVELQAVLRSRLAGDGRRRRRSRFAGAAPGSTVDGTTSARRLISEGVTCAILLTEKAVMGSALFATGSQTVRAERLLEGGREERGARLRPVPGARVFKLTAGTCANISTVLKPGLTRAEFIRLAIDEKIAQLRREAGIGVERGVGTVVIGRDQTVGMIAVPT